MVVEKVEKLMEVMGCLMFYGEKEEEEDVMEVLWLLEMEEGMEVRMVEVLVKEWWRRWWSLDGQRREKEDLWAAGGFSGNGGGKRREKVKREKEVG